MIRKVPHASRHDKSRGAWGILASSPPHDTMVSKKTNGRLRTMDTLLKNYTKQLQLEEKSVNSIDQYTRKARRFLVWLEGQEQAMTQENVLAYIHSLPAELCPRSRNHIIILLNHFLTHLGYPGWRVKTLRIQEDLYAEADKEITQKEYEQLVGTAYNRGDTRLAAIIQTIAATGIRVSELRAITVAAVKAGRAQIDNKGTLRKIFIGRDLVRLLKDYCKKNHIKNGPIFITRTGRPMDRSNIWRALKNLCVQAGIDPRKGFPHNLRHLFARSFYEKGKDIARLANILGHKSIETTRIYIKTSGQEERQILNSLAFIKEPGHFSRRQ